MCFGKPFRHNWGLNSENPHNSHKSQLFFGKQTPLAGQLRTGDARELTWMLGKSEEIMMMMGKNCSKESFNPKHVVRENLIEAPLWFMRSRVNSSPSLLTMMPMWPWNDCADNFSPLSIISDLQFRWIYTDLLLFHWAESSHIEY